MTLRSPITLAAALAVALAVAPGAARAKDNGKNKDKDKSKHEQDSDLRNDGRHDNDDDDQGDNGQGHDKVTICHGANGGSGGHTITVGESAWSAHRAHGDYLGACGVGRVSRSRFDDLDRNGDSILSRREWPRDDASFRRADLNHDGVITRGEFSRF
jgi:hypothetical protein